MIYPLTYALVAILLVFALHKRQLRHTNWAARVTFTLIVLTAAVIFVYKHTVIRVPRLAAGLIRLLEPFDPIE